MYLCDDCHEVEARYSELTTGQKLCTECLKIVFMFDDDDDEFLSDGEEPISFQQ
ncbi:MAG: hypothetical protein Q8O88_01090 [bacterium]|nr:hypothetical protein [bacterium]